MSFILPVAYIFSKQSFLTKNLIDELGLKSCKVILIDENGLKNFKKPDEEPSYIFLIEGFSSKDSFFSESELQIVFNFISTSSAKTEIVLPYVINEIERSKVEQTSFIAKQINKDNLNIIYLGQIYGPQMDIYENNYIPLSLREIYLSENVSIPSYESEIYLIDIKNAIKFLLKGIFSYGFPKKEIVITAKTTIHNYFSELQNIIPSLSASVDLDLKPFGTVSCFDFMYVDRDANILKETIEWIKTLPLDKVEQKIKPKEKVLAKKVVNKIKIPKVKVKSPVRIKSVAIFILVLFWIIALPFLSLFISSLTLKLGFKELKNDNLSRANFYFNITSSLSNFSSVPLHFFNEGLKVSLIMNDFSEVGKRTSQTLKLGETIGKNVLGNNDYDFSGESNQLFLNLDDLYREASFLKAEINSTAAASYFVPTTNLDDYIKYLNNTKTLSNKLSQLLGGDGKKTYLVLIQDSSELRPTGGLIKTIGIFTFDKGRLVDKTFLDAADVDSSFRGQVNTPQPIQKYLGVTNWSLKNSNWDPDFINSAAKAEWFLENETGDKPNGVIAVDSSFFDNVKDFKGTFLEWGSKLLEGLNSKNIQVFLNDDSLSTALYNLNWNGGVNIPTCSGNCGVDFLSVVEANLGLNNVNSNINRTENLTVTLNGKNLEHKLEINFDNTSSENTYRNYIRVLTNLNSNFGKVSESIDGFTQYFNPDVVYSNGHTEGGVLVQIPQNTKAQLIFTWTTQSNIDFTKTGKLVFYMRKQPGISSIQSFIKFNLVDSLTYMNPTSYNTSLTGDFNTQINW